jgi:hypothetical protein
MKKMLAACCLVVGVTAFAEAPAAAAPAAPAMDMTKMGPAARKPTNEKATKKECEEFFKKMEAAGQKGDLEATAAMHDFPLFMATDDLKGVPEAKSYSKEEFVAMMKPFYENMPKDAKTTHKPAYTVLSDSLVVVVDDFTMTMGKTKIAGKNSGLLVKVGGEWKFKSMVEAGWGGMPPPAAPVAAAPAAAPAPAAKTPAAAPAAPAAPAKK